MKYNNYDSALLETKRLILNKGTIKDYLKVYEYDFKKLMCIDDMIEFEKEDEKRIKSWFNGGINKYFRKLVKAHMFDWIIYLDNDAIGNILTGDEDIKNNGIELIFNIHPDYWGKGYAPEAAASVLDYLFKIGYDNIICGYIDGDTKSKRVLSKLGFKPFEIKSDAVEIEKGTLADKYVMIMTKENWLSRTTKIAKIKESV